jgi:beta-lactamase regulating signal transducer with metallopeptidase domain
MNTALPLDASIMPFLDWLLRTSLSAAAIAGLVLLVQLLFGRWLTPAWRYRLWDLVVVRLLLPVVPPSATSMWNVARFVPSVHPVRTNVDGSRSEPQEVPADRVRSDSPVVTYGPVPSQVRAGGQATAVATSSGNDRVEALLTLATTVWLVIAVVLFGRLVILNLILSRRLRLATRVTDPHMLDRFDRCCRASRVSRQPVLAVTDVVRVPAAAGFWRPRILLPPGLLDRLSPDELDAILLHELAHIRCRDIAINWLLAALQSVHWFNPLLWFAFARLRADREAARDAMVLRVLARRQPGAAADEYGGTLVKIAELLLPGHGRPHAAAGVFAGLFGEPAVLLPHVLARRSGLQRRLQMIMRYPQGARRRSWLGPALMVLLAAAALTRAKDPPRPAATAPASLPVQLIMQSDPYKQPQAPPELQRKLDLILPQVTFDVVGFGDVLHFFGDVSGIKINVNWEALRAAGVDQSTPVTARLRNIKFSKALNVILDSVGGGQVKLGFVVRNDALLISSREDFAKEVQIRVYDVRDLIIPIEPQGGRNAGTGRPATEPASSPASRATHPAASRDEQVTQLIRLIEETVAPTSWKDPHGSPTSRIAEVEGQLIVTQTGENQQAIHALLDQVRESRVPRVQIESQFVRCDERTVNDLLAGWHKTVAQPPYAAAEAGIVLDDAQAKELLRACQAPGSENSISAGPPLTLFNGQSAAMQFAPDNRSYVLGYKPAKSPAGQTRYEPVHDDVHAGFFFEVQASATGDRQPVTLGIRVKASALLRMERTPWPFAPAGSDLQVESPQIKSAELRTTANVPSGQTVLVGGLEDFGISPEGPPAERPARTGHRLFMLVRPTLLLPGDGTRKGDRTP